MLTLKILQLQLQDYLIDCNHQTIKCLIQENEQLSSTTRLEIYHSAYRLRLLEILKNDFPKLHFLLGDEEFNKIGLSYIDTYPSQHFSVRFFGQNFPKFLKEIYYSDDAYLYEMAVFEWALGDTLDASDDEVVQLEALHDIPLDEWAYVGLSFHPSCQILTFEWNTPQLWQTIDKNEALTKPVQMPEPLTWFLWRKEIQNYFRSLEPAQTSSFKAIQKGCCFSELCELLCETNDENTVPQIALTFIQQCLMDGCISKITIKTDHL